MPTSEQTIVKRVTELVAADSVSSPDPSWDSSNRRVIRHLSNYAERDGWAVNIQELESTADGKANLIATLGNTDNLGDGPAGLVLSGHTDTVPFDAGGWASDPLKLTERDGRLYGLGSTDMKGFFVPRRWKPHRSLIRPNLKRRCIYLRLPMKRVRCEALVHSQRHSYPWRELPLSESLPIYGLCGCTRAS